ncbi:MAG TPA: alpha/beta hydrolase, partial [Acetobacteraceae bacterium]|nr:alpha/beta hydrolase [Acetobacteraceae bacterium]
MLRPRRALLASLLLGLLFAGTAAAQTLPGVADRFFQASDGTRLHYLEAGPSTAHTIVLVPGWTMPAWIWSRQIADFRSSFHVIAFDPRGQGASAIAPSGYEPNRRGQDIAELLARLGPRPVLLVGWSLGVLDTLAYVHTHGDRAIAGLVLVDNSVGENPAPSAVHHRPHKPVPHPEYMEHFVRAMFRTPQNPAWLDRLTEATLHTPDWAARELLAYPVPRSYWREAVYATTKPVLYVVRPGFAAQAAN